MKPYYDQDGITIYHGDCRDVLPLLPPCDLVLTDPPYGVDYAAWDASVPYDLLPMFLKMATGAVLWFGASAMLRRDLAAFPVEPDRTLVWAPSFTLKKATKHGLYYRWHPIYAWRLPDKHEGPASDVLTTPTDGRNFWNHPATKPLKLIRQLVGFCEPGGIVVDPFMGSGTTLRAAMDLGLRAIGIELEERYCEVAVKRLSQQVLPLGIAS